MTDNLGFSPTINNLTYTIWPLSFFEESWIDSEVCEN